MSNFKNAKNFKASKPQKKASDDIAIKRFVSEGAIRLLPVEKDVIIARVENLADLFDNKPVQTFYFNMQKFARDLYFEINGVEPTLVFIQETELSSGMLLTKVK